MADPLTFLMQPSVLVAVGLIVIVVIIYLIARWKNKPKGTPDMIDEFCDSFVSGMKYNSLSPEDCHFVSIGSSVVAKIKKKSKNNYKIPLSFDEKDKKLKVEIHEGELTALIVQPRWKWKIYNVFREDIMFIDSKNAYWDYANDVITLPVGTAWEDFHGRIFIQKTVYEAGSKIVVDDWNKRMFETSTDAFANQMQNLAGFVPDYAQLREMEDKKIQAAEEQKKLQRGSLL